MSTYTTRYFGKIQEGAVRSARATVPLIIGWIQPSSVVDVGCGNGTWLSVFREMGVGHVLGIDGDYVNRDQLLIPVDSFVAADLSNPPPVEERFDLAVSLEVAEHLPPEHADRFIRFVTSLAPVVMFSAAIPHQGGADHVNEQWPDYWAAIFEKCGFTPVDCLRPRLWTNDAVEWWYAQNILLFLRPSDLRRFPQLAHEAELSRGRPFAVVHPKGYAMRVEWARGIDQVRRELSPFTPLNGTLILIDDGQSIFPDGGSTRPFLERNGVYWGPPTDDGVAIREVERMIAEGATCIAIGWPAFWWLDYYQEFARHLRENFPCLHASKHLLVFDLQKRHKCYLRRGAAKRRLST